ncbi:hypothetical protein [Rivularia sp. UHCC 0363]|nr:hypothetical protein [Rivularia sp. UHCC 0363]MEA5599242.1 hypothetical protein [Rivularia sp. UHCC 0363]
MFNPRRQIWDEHFYIKNANIEGKTQIAQATARLLQEECSGSAYFNDKY